jgi:hypothetical protein
MSARAGVNWNCPTSAPKSATRSFSWHQSSKIIPGSPRGAASGSACRSFVTLSVATEQRLLTGTATPLCCRSLAARWSSLVARRAHNPKVVGSNPTRATDTPEKGRHRTGIIGRWFPFWVCSGQLSGHERGWGDPGAGTVAVRHERISLYGFPAALAGRRLPWPSPPGTPLTGASAGWTRSGGVRARRSSHVTSVRS